MTHTDPYPALGTDYRPPFECATTNRGLSLTQQEVQGLKAIVDALLAQANEQDMKAPAYVESLSDKVNKL